MKLTYIALATLALLGANNSVNAADKSFGDGCLISSKLSTSMETENSPLRSAKPLKQP
jgi:hypothetical protein